MTAPRPLDGLMHLEDVAEILMLQARLPRSVRLRCTLFFPTREQH